MLLNTQFHDLLDKKEMNILVEKAVWQPTEYKCTCPHCKATIFSKTPEKNIVCTECNKEFLASVAHTEE
jgi:transposase-like protein